MWDLAVEQHPTWNRSVLNCPVQWLPSKVSSNQPESTQDRDNCTSCLASLLPSKSLYHFYVTIMLMSACCSLWSHSQAKMVFGKIGDTYQAYCNTYKTHTVATHHRGSGSSLDRDTDMTREPLNTADTGIEDTQDFNTAETVHFEDLKHKNPTKLTALTKEIDDLHQWVQAEEGQPTETLNCIECKLQKLSIVLYPPAPTKPLERC